MGIFAISNGASSDGKGEKKPTEMLFGAPTRVVIVCACVHGLQPEPKEERRNNGGEERSEEDGEAWNKREKGDTAL